AAENFCETDLSTEQTGAQAASRLPCTHGDQGRPQGFGRTTRARAEETERLAPASVGIARAVRSFQSHIDCNGLLKCVTPKSVTLSRGRQVERLKRRSYFRAAAQAARPGARRH